MGFKLFKWNQTTPSSDSSDLSVSTAPTSHQPSPTRSTFKSLPKTKSTATLFERFRSQPDPLEAGTTTSNSSRPPASRTRPPLSIITPGKYQGYDNGDVRDNEGRPASRSSMLPPPNRSRFLGGSSKGHSTLSLPLQSSNRHAEPTEPAEKKSSRWKFGLGSRRRSISSVSSPTGSSHLREGSGAKGGFEVRSFRTVSRVHEDSRPYTTSPTSYSAPYPPLGLGGPAVTAPPKNRHDNQNPRAPSPSPSISVEAFRLASARNHSSSSLYSPRSPEAPERPRFEPTRSNRSSVGNLDALTGARRSSYIESTTPYSHNTLGAPNHNSAKMTTTESSYSLASFKSAHSTASDDKEAHTRDRAISGDELDEELRLIAMYGSGEVSSTNRRQSFGSTQALKPVKKPSFPPPRPAARITPSLALVPASPDPPMQVASKRSSRVSLSATSTRSFGERKTQVNWNDDSDEEDEDDLPLAVLSDTRRRSRSEVSLLLPPSPLLANERGGRNRWSADLDRQASHDQEILTEEATSSPGSSTRGGRQGAREPTIPSNAPRPASLAGSSSTLPRKADVTRQISRRSMSTLSFGSNTAPFPPAAPVRTFSNPPSTSGIIPAIPFSNNVESNASRPERTSAQSSSTSDSASSSQPKTPKDGSPGGSMLGMRVGSGLKDNSYTPDDTILAIGSIGVKNGNGKWDSLPVQTGSIAGQSQNNKGAQRIPQRTSQQFATLPRPSSYLPSPSPSPSRSVADFRSYSAPSSPRLPTHSRAGSAGQGEQYERMRVRHKAEAANAVAIGRDLNGTGLMDDDEEDDVPLAAIPSKRGSVAGSSYGAPSNQQQHQFPSYGSFGPQAFPEFDQFSQIPSTAPPGVDPYLYAALPADQKMNLHFRSQQMLQMMAQASYQAKAESEMGWDNTSAISGGGGDEQRRFSMGGGMGYAMPSNRLPPFAPSNSASQAFFQSQTPPSLHSQSFNPYQTQFQSGYGMYGGGGGMSGAQSAIGVSTMGNAEKRSSHVPNRGSASTIGKY